MNKQYTFFQIIRLLRQKDQWKRIFEGMSPYFQDDVYHRKELIRFYMAGNGIHFYDVNTSHIVFAPDCLEWMILHYFVWRLRVFMKRREKIVKNVRNSAGL